MKMLIHQRLDIKEKTMTSEEAIKKLMFERDKIDTEGYCGTKENYAKIDAFNMAIEALENKPIPCERCIHVKSCRKVIILKNRTYKLVKYCSQGAERREP